MAVEKMHMMDVIGDLSYLDSVMTDILKDGSVELVNVMSEIENNRFTFRLEDSNLEKTIDLNYVSHFQNEEQGNVRTEMVSSLKRFYNIGEVEAVPDFKLTGAQNLESYYKSIKSDLEELDELEEKLGKMSNLEENFALFKNVDIDLKELEELEYFEARFGLLTSEGRIRMKRNYGNILAVIYHTGTQDDKEVYLAIYPKEVKHEIDRILKSLNWQDIEILGKYSGTPKQILEDLINEEDSLRKRKEEIEFTRDANYEKDRDLIMALLYSEVVKDSIEDHKRYMARSDKFFYLSGWISDSDKPAMERILNSYDDILLTFKDPKDGDLVGKPPTKLKNSGFFKPFELLVKMYGIPGYKELDPTVFVGITYMIFFGAMFGDVGQGALFILAGFLISKLKDKMAGGLMTRVGISSTVFGFLYGSVFGDEHLLPALWIRPFESINTVLIASIGFGVFLLSMAYVLNLLNCINRRDIEEGLLGNEGVIAFAIFLSLLGFALQKVLGKTVVQPFVLMGIILLGLAALMLKPIILSLMTKEKPEYESGAVSYYVENGFSVIEMLISMVSGTISFIRLGAFAINHVGLFMAFQTIGQMIGSGFGNIAMLVIGNIIIIALEGMIVFIQGLRLEYYELFNKYYKGDGYEFDPATIKN